MIFVTTCPRCAAEQEAHPKYESCHACGYFGVMFLRTQEESLVPLKRTEANELPATVGRDV